MDINKTLAEEFKLRQEQIDNTVALLDDDKTIPFIARYRKELTGSLDDQVLREIADRLTYLRNLEKRKGEIISSITEQEKMTDEIMSAIENAKTLVEVEDIYRPFKPKRKTRASVAREKGLEPLAELILTQDKKCDPQVEGSKFINEDKGVKSADEALQGAMDIIAEDISDDADLRKYIRTLFSQIGVISSKASDENTESVYENYYDYAEAVGKIAGHRVLALDRGEKEGVLKVSVNVPEGAGERACVSRYVKNKSECGQLVTAACEDGYKRLIYPSIEREIRAELSANAQEGAIKVFSSNLRQLLMQPPVKDTVTLGLDPGYAHGCKTAVVDATGKVLDTAIIYITPPKKDTERAKRILTGFIKKYGVTTISIGNGTASRETEQFTAELIKEIPQKVSYMVVSEAGASVYQQGQGDQKAQRGAGLPAVQDGGGPRLYDGIAQTADLDGVFVHIVDPGAQGGEAAPGGLDVLGVRQAVDHTDAPMDECGGDEEPVGLGLAGRRRHATGELFRCDAKIHLIPPVPRR